MPPLTFPTPEEAALEEFPAQACRVAAVARDGDDAYVVVDTGAPGQPYLYGVSASRHDGGWVGGTSGNGPGWIPADAEDGLGTATAWGQAPEGTTRVRASYRGDVREAPVARGVYLVAWFRVPAPADGGGARVDAFRIREQWTRPGPPADPQNPHHPQRRRSLP